MENKVCKMCCNSKSVDEYYKATSTKDGYMGKCKRCMALDRLHKLHGKDATILAPIKPVLNLPIIDFDRDMRSNGSSHYRFNEHHNTIKRALSIAFKQGHFNSDTFTINTIGINYEELVYHLNDNDWGFTTGHPKIALGFIKPIQSCIISKNRIDKNKYEKLWHYTNLMLVPYIFKIGVLSKMEYQPICLKIWLEKEQWHCGKFPDNISKYDQSKRKIKTIKRYQR